MWPPLSLAAGSQPIRFIACAPNTWGPKSSIDSVPYEVFKDSPPCTYFIAGLEDKIQVRRSGECCTLTGESQYWLLLQGECGLG